jgi:glutaconate CoA-transferase subunit B
MSVKPEELLIAVIARLLDDVRHVAVGMSSPIPGSAALLQNARSGGATRVTVLGSPKEQAFADTGVEMFDCAGEGRVDAFFLGGGQIDGEANINLVGIGDYPKLKVRWPGSFGSAYLYFVVPRVILFREEHTRRVLVPKVDFVSAPGTSPPNVYRRGGPVALVTNRCLFSFDRNRRRFTLESVHPGETVDSIKENTGFNFDVAANVGETPPPDADTLRLIRTEIAARIADAYPQFAAQVFGFVPERRVAV